MQRFWVRGEMYSHWPFDLEWMMRLNLSGIKRGFLLPHCLTAGRDFETESGDAGGVFSEVGSVLEGPAEQIEAECRASAEVRCVAETRSFCAGRASFPEVSTLCRPTEAGDLVFVLFE